MSYVTVSLDITSQCLMSQSIESWNSMSQCLMSQCLMSQSIESWNSMSQRFNDCRRLAPVFRVYYNDVDWEHYVTVSLYHSVFDSVFGHYVTVCLGVMSQ